jgi:hypothetical protein
LAHDRELFAAAFAAAALLLVRGRDEALTMHFTEIAPTSAFAIRLWLPCGVLPLIPDGDPSSTAVVIDVKTVAEV